MRGIPGASVNDLSADTNNAVYAATEYGLYVLRDHTDAWKDISPQKEVYRAVVASHAGYLFAGDQWYVYRSSDAGATWENLGFTPVYSVFGMAEDHNGYMFVCGADGIARSTDNGNTWMHSGFYYYVEEFAVTPDNLIFAATDDGVIRSTDNGNSWQPIGPGFHATITALASNRQGDVFAGTYYSGVYRSTDKGVSWENISGIIPWSLIDAIEMDSSGSLYLGKDGVPGIFKSTDNGDSWMQSDSGYMSGMATCFSVSRDGHVFAGSDDGGVYCTENSRESWIHTSSGLDMSHVVSLLCTDGVVFAGTGAGIYRSTDRGESWIPAYAGFTKGIGWGFRDRCCWSHILGVFRRRFFPFDRRRRALDGDQ